MTDTVDSMTLKELRSYAATLDIPGRSKLKREELIAAIRALRTADNDDADDAPSEVLADVVDAQPADADADPDLLATSSSSTLTAHRALERTVSARQADIAPVGTPKPTPVHPHAGKGPLLPPLNLKEPSMDYDDAFLTLLPQTPTSLVAIWCLTDAERNAFGSAPVELRLVDQTWGHQVVLRASPGLDGRRWHIAGLTADREYRAFLGRLDGDNFVPVLYSRTLALPPDRPRPWTEAARTRWASFGVTTTIPLDEMPIGEATRPWWGGSSAGGAQ